MRQKKYNKLLSIIFVFIFVFSSMFFNSVDAARRAGRVNVRGYYRKDGTYVRPHTRRYPNTNGNRSIIISDYNRENKNNNNIVIKEEELKKRETYILNREKEIRKEIEKLDKQIEELNNNKKEIKELIKELEIKGYVVSYIDKYVSIPTYISTSSAKSYINITKYKKSSMNSDIYLKELDIKSAEEEIEKQLKYILDTKEDLNNRKAKLIKIKEKVDGNIKINNEKKKRYIDYKKFNTIYKSNLNTEIIIKFSGPIDKETINDDSFELIDKDTFDKLGLNYKFLDDKTIKLKPTKILKSGQVYWLVINNNIKDIYGKSLKKGVLSEVYTR